MSKPPEIVKTSRIHTSTICSVSFSPDQTKLCSGGYDSNVRVWDIESGNSKCFEGHTEWICCVDYSPDGRFLASGSADSTLRLWEEDSGKHIEFENFGHFSYVECVRFSSDGRFVLSGSGDKSVKKWDVERKKRISEVNSKCWVFSVDISKNDNILVTGHGYPDFHVVLRDFRTEKWIHTFEGAHEGGVSSVKFRPTAPFSHVVASASWDQHIKLFDIRTFKCFQVFHDHTDRVYRISFHPNGEFIISGSDDSTIKIYDLNTIKNEEEEQQHRKAVMFNYDFTQEVPDIKDINRPTCLLNNPCQFSPEDGRFFATGYDGNLCLWKSNINMLTNEILSKQDEGERKTYLLEYLIDNLEENIVKIRSSSSSLSENNNCTMIEITVPRIFLF